MRSRHMRQQICSLAVASALAFGCLFASANPTRAAATDAPACVVPKDVARLALPLKRTARQLDAHKLTLVVALGSSSTAGVGASSAVMAYPNRLMVELGQRFPKQPLMVLNRGIPGARAVDMLARFDETAAAEHPDLVLWQVGTNAVLRGYEHSKSDAVIRDGIRRMKAIGADVVLIDPQFAPKVIANPEIDDMVDLISSAGAQAKADVFHRFALMRYWHDVEKIPFETFLSSDGLHMKDWAYSCFAKALAEAIGDAVAPDGTSGKENPRLDDSAATASRTGQTH
jgi:acyl-CoA thioesterase-1